MINDNENVTIFGWMGNRFDLSKNDLSVYAYLYSHTVSHNCFSGSLQHIADFYGFDKRTVIRSIKQLEEKKLIMVNRNNGSTSNIETIIKYDPTKNNNVSQNEPVTNCHHYQCQIVTATSDKLSPNNTINNTIYNNNINNKNNKKLSATEQYNKFPQNHYDYDELEKDLLSN